MTTSTLVGQGGRSRRTRARPGRRRPLRRRARTAPGSRATQGGSSVRRERRARRHRAGARVRRARRSLPCRRVPACRARPTPVDALAVVCPPPASRWGNESASPQVAVERAAPDHGDAVLADGHPRHVQHGAVDSLPARGARAARRRCLLSGTECRTGRVRAPRAEHRRRCRPSRSPRCCVRQPTRASRDTDGPRPRCATRRSAPPRPPRPRAGRA